jgi:hypothetical protein
MKNWKLSLITALVAFFGLVSSLPIWAQGGAIGPPTINVSGTTTSHHRYHQHHSSVDPRFAQYQNQLAELNRRVNNIPKTPTNEAELGEVRKAVRVGWDVMEGVRQRAKNSVTYDEFGNAMQSMANINNGLLSRVEALEQAKKATAATATATSGQVPQETNMDEYFKWIVLGVLVVLALSLMGMFHSHNQNKTKMAAAPERDTDPAAGGQSVSDILYGMGAIAGPGEPTTSYRKYNRRGVQRGRDGTVFFDGVDCYVAPQTQHVNDQGTRNGGQVNHQGQITQNGHVNHSGTVNHHHHLPKYDQNTTGRPGIPS